MELIAIICVHGPTPLYAKNKLHRLTKYTVSETRAYMRRCAIIHAVYSYRIAQSLIRHIHRHAVVYDYKDSFGCCRPYYGNGYIFIPIIQKNCGMSAFRDVTIIASESIYMPDTLPKCSRLIHNGNIITSVTMQCIIKKDVYKYRMRLPTRFNPICTCCTHIWGHLNIELEHKCAGLRPDNELKKVIKYIKVKTLHKNHYQSHICSLTPNLFSQTVSIATYDDM